MEHQEVQAETAKHKDSSLATYSIIVYSGAKLPEQYKPIIFSRWLRSLRYGNEYFKKIRPSVYWDVYHRYIERLLLQGHTTVRMAVLTQDPDVVLGYAVTRGHILDYVHVHRDMRKMGIAKSLIPPGITDITHLTKDATPIWKYKCKTWGFNPFA